jgi:hypothetical protein
LESLNGHARISAGDIKKRKWGMFAFQQHGAQCSVGTPMGEIIIVYHLTIDIPTAHEEFLVLSGFRHCTSYWICHGPALLLADPV